MSSYIGKHAEYYDIIYSEKNYHNEVKFINDLIVKYLPKAKKLIDIACGTGNHSFFLEKLGFSVMGIDYSKDMINRALSKKDQLLSSVIFQVDDMRELQSIKEKFDVALCLFDSIGYAQNNADIQKVIKKIANLIDDNGLFIFEYWHAAAMLTQYDKNRERIFPINGGYIKRKSQTELDVEKQLATVHYTIEEYSKDNKLTNRIEESQINRFFLKQEMNLIIEKCDLIEIEAFNGFSNNKIIDLNTWHILSVCRKK